MKLCNIGVLIFSLALARNEHGLKMSILATTLFGPTMLFPSTYWAT